MAQHSILEIDEQELRAWRVEVGRSSAVVLDARRVPLVDHGVAALVAATDAVSEVLTGKTQVLLASRRFLFLRIELPREARRNAADAIEREFRRRGHFEESTPLMVGSHIRSVKRKGGKRGGLDVYSAVALPETDWTPYARALDRLEADVVCVRSLEDCIADGIEPESRGVSLFADQVGSRLRLVTCVDGAVAQVRRLPLPPSADGGSDRIDFVLGQLAIEIPRTIEVLQRERIPTPRRLVLGESLHVPRGQLGLLDSVLQDGVSFYEAVTDPGEIPLVPGAAVDGVIARIRRGEIRNWESRGGQSSDRREGTAAKSVAKPVLPRIGWLPVAAAVAPLLLAGVVGSFQSAATDRVRTKNLGLERELQTRKEQEAFRASQRADRPEASTAGMRRPLSLAHAELCRIAPPSVSYDRLELDHAEGLSLEGHVADGSRTERLLAIATLVERAGALPFFGGVIDSISEGDDRQIVFRLRADWRNP